MLSNGLNEINNQNYHTLRDNLKNGKLSQSYVLVVFTQSHFIYYIETTDRLSCYSGMFRGV